MKSRAKPKSIRRSKGTAELEEAVKQSGERKYLLRLYITGATPRSTRAIQNVKRICEENLKGRYILEVVDIYQQPEKAKSDDILAAPTLIKQLPSPLRKLIGDMANTERVLVGLDLEPKN
jgi:circadian clock protein KaiB